MTLQLQPGEETVSLDVTNKNIALNLLEQTTLSSLREVQHKDANGNPIGKLEKFGTSHSTHRLIQSTSSRSGPLKSNPTTP